MKFSLVFREAPPQLRDNLLGELFSLESNCTVLRPAIQNVAELQSIMGREFPRHRKEPHPNKTDKHACGEKNPMRRAAAGTISQKQNAIHIDGWQHGILAMRKTNRTSGELRHLKLVEDVTTCGTTVELWHIHAC